MVSCVLRNIIKKFVVVSTIAICFGQSNMADEFGQEIIVTCKVICREWNPFGWSMEYAHLDTFFIRVIKVVRGEEKSEYLRIAYGYNLQKDALPEEMFDGETVQEFYLTRWSIFDRAVKVDKVTDSSSGDEKRQEKKNFAGLPDLNVCIATSGNQKEAEELEKMGILKGYWLDKHALLE